MNEDDAVVKERFRSRRLDHEREAATRRFKYGLMVVLFVPVIGVGVALVYVF